MSLVVHRASLVCGIVSTTLYFAIDAFGALSYPNYDYASQTISEMSAIGAPTRFVLAPLYLVYSVLLLAFAFGVRAAAGEMRGVRMAGNLLTGVGFVGLLLFFFPMQMRGTAPAFTDLAHVVLGGVNSFLLLLAIGFAAGAFGPRFRLYSIATILVMLVFGAWTAWLAPLVAENRPTPWLGIVERVLFASFLLWIAGLAVMLFRATKADETAARRSASYRESASRPGAVA